MLTIIPNIIGEPLAPSQRLSSRLAAGLWARCHPLLFPPWAGMRSAQLTRASDVTPTGSGVEAGSVSTPIACSPGHSFATSRAYKGYEETHVGDTSHNACTRGLAHMRTVTGKPTPPKTVEREKPTPALRHHVDEVHKNDEE